MLAAPHWPARRTALHPFWTTCGRTKAWRQRRGRECTATTARRWTLPRAMVRTPKFARHSAWLAGTSTCRRIRAVRPHTVVAASPFAESFTFIVSVATLHVGVPCPFPGDRCVPFLARTQVYHHLRQPGRSRSCWPPPKYPWCATDVLILATWNARCCSTPSFHQYKWQYSVHSTLPVGKSSQRGGRPLHHTILCEATQDVVWDAGETAAAAPMVQ